MDFSKLKPKTHYTYVTYVCRNCGRSIEFVGEMPQDCLKHDDRIDIGGGRIKRCGGQLVESSRRTVTREEHMR